MFKLDKKHKKKIEDQKCNFTHISNDNELNKIVAKLISEGKVVGWFQGKMEWGPRALGNRSILGDPRRSNMKDILNLKIKRRESFRPFAPSILREHVSNWFENDEEENEYGHKKESLKPLIIAEMQEKIPTISVGEAVMQMELSGANMLIFRNSSHQKINVVHLREDGNIGWVDPEHSN